MGNLYFEISSLDNTPQNRAERQKIEQEIINILGENQTLKQFYQTSPRVNLFNGGVGIGESDRGISLDQLDRLISLCNRTMHTYRMAHTKYVVGDDGREQCVEEKLPEEVIRQVLMCEAVRSTELHAVNKIIEQQKKYRTDDYNAYNALRTERDDYKSKLEAASNRINLLSTQLAAYKSKQKKNSKRAREILRIAHKLH